MDVISYGTIQGEPKKLIKHDNDSVYIGKVSYNESIHRCYIKKLRIGLVIHEYIGAKFAQAIGLEVPKPIIAKWNDQIVFCSVQENKFTLAFGLSEEVPIDVRNKVASDFLSWGNLNLAACFDELIYNPDRSKGNILIDFNGVVSVIDHAFSFIHDKNKINSQNFLMNLVVANQAVSTESQKQELLRTLDATTSQLLKIPYVEIFNSLSKENLILETRSQELVEYTECRLRQLKLFLSDHLKTSQSDFMYA